MKKCTDCGQKRKEEDFGKNASRKDGLGQLCKYCKRQRARYYRFRRKVEVLSAYSHGEPICACCKVTEIEFLTIDHVHGDGNEHRKELSSGQLYGWLKRNSYPPGFRVLCFNCNTSIGLFGHCPHQNPEISVRLRSSAYQLRGKARGEKVGSSKLTEKDVISIKRSLLSGESVRALSTTYGVCRFTISSIRDGHTWVDI
ncbi:hypothetical protein LCGC14_2664180 [marine sediment metagenome]|uniref:Uncharacterized protein n=1 Tax=marine sediment metagenome TaxID=412755 RepID=A0A0F9CHY5_9ZZZZ